MKLLLLAALAGLSAPAARAEGEHDHHGGGGEMTTKSIAPSPTNQPQIQPAPNGSDLTREQLEAERDRLSAKYPGSANVIRQIFNVDLIAGHGKPAMRADLPRLEAYIRARDRAKGIAARYAENGQDLDSVQANRPNIFKRIFSKLSSYRMGDLIRFEKTQGEMREAMHALHRTAFADAVMQDKWAHTFMGNAAEHDRDYAGARPNDPRPLFNIGQRLREDGDAKGAVDSLSKGLALDPDNAEGLAQRAAAFAALGDAVAAAADAARALQLNPDNRMAQQVHAMTAGRSGRGAGGSGGEPPSGSAASAGGGAGFGQSASAQPVGYTLSAPQATGGREAARQFALGDHEAAERAASAAIAKNPKDLLSHFYLSAARLRRGDAAGALAAAEAGLAVDPRSSALLLAKAQALNRLGRYRDALAAARLASEINPRDAGALVAGAEALAGLGDRAGALAALKSAAELDPRFQPLYQEALASDDLLALFQGEGGAKGAAAARAKASPLGGRAAAAGAGAVGLLIAAAAALLLRKRDSAA